MTLQPPASIKEFQVGDEVECIESARVTQAGERVIVSNVEPDDYSSDEGFINFARLDGTPRYGSSGRGTKGWRRFAIVDSDTPNY